jgi:hypothetical protein
MNAKPIGEFANNGPPAAIANAIADAVGIRLFELPLSAEKLYYLLKDQNRNHPRQILYPVAPKSPRQLV